MSETYAQGAQPTEGVRMEHREDGRDELVVRLNWNTCIVAAAAFAIGVLVGFVLD